MDAVTVTGETPTHAAAQHGATAALTALTAAGARLDHFNSQGVAPLHWAAINGHTECVKLLLQANAQVRVTGLRPVWVTAAR